MLLIEKFKENGYGFSIKSENGLILMRSIAFDNQEDIKNATEYLKSVRDEQNVFERKTNHDGKFLFNVKYAGGRILGFSELYSSEAGMENGINNLKNRIATLTALGKL